jgi:hypothetical protein
MATHDFLSGFTQVANRGLDNRRTKAYDVAAESEVLDRHDTQQKRINVNAANQISQMIGQRMSDNPGLTEQDAIDAVAGTDEFVRLAKLFGKTSDGFVNHINSNQNRQENGVVDRTNPVAGFDYHRGVDGKQPFWTTRLAPNPERGVFGTMSDGISNFFSETEDASSDPEAPVVQYTNNDVYNAVQETLRASGLEDNRSPYRLTTSAQRQVDQYNALNPDQPSAIPPDQATVNLASRNYRQNPTTGFDKLLTQTAAGFPTGKTSRTTGSGSSRGSGSSKNAPSNTELEQELVKTYVKDADKLSNFTGDISSKNPDTMLTQYNTLKTKLENQKKGGSLSIQQMQAVDAALTSIEGVPDFAMQLAIQKQNDGKGFTPEGWSDADFWSDTGSAVPELWDMWDPTASVRANMKVLVGINDPKGYPVVGNPNYLNHLQINENNNITWTPGTTDDEILENRNKPMGVFGVSDDTTAGDPINFGQIESEYPLAAQYLREKIGKKDVMWGTLGRIKKINRELRSQEGQPDSPEKKQQLQVLARQLEHAQRMAKDMGYGELKLNRVDVGTNKPTERKPFSREERDLRTQTVLEHQSKKKQPVRTGRPR